MSINQLKGKRNEIVEYSLGSVVARGQRRIGNEEVFVATSAVTEGMSEERRLHGAFWVERSRLFTPQLCNARSPCSFTRPDPAIVSAFAPIVDHPYVSCYILFSTRHS